MKINTTFSGDINASLEKWVASCGQNVITEKSTTTIPNLGIKIIRKNDYQTIVVFGRESENFRYVFDNHGVYSSMKFYGSERDYGYGDIRQMVSETNVFGNRF